MAEVGCIGRPLFHCDNELERQIGNTILRSPKGQAAGSRESRPAPYKDRRPNRQPTFSDLSPAKVCSDKSSIYINRQSRLTGYAGSGTCKMIHEQKFRSAGSLAGSLGYELGSVA